MHLKMGNFSQGHDKEKKFQIFFLNFRFKKISNLEIYNNIWRIYERTVTVFHFLFSSLHDGF
jgi:hypothetical protein